jgi:hypothetical protein
MLKWGKLNFFHTYILTNSVSKNIRNYIWGWNRVNNFIRDGHCSFSVKNPHHRLCSLGYSDSKYNSSYRNGDWFMN